MRHTHSPIDQQRQDMPTQTRMRESERMKLKKFLELEERLIIKGKVLKLLKP